MISTSGAFSDNILILSSSDAVKYPPSFCVLLVKIIGVLVIFFTSWIISVASEELISFIVSNLNSMYST